MNDLNAVNTYAGIILPQLTAPAVIIIFKQFFEAVPGELRDAAVIDGANEGASCLISFSRSTGALPGHLLS